MMTKRTRKPKVEAANLPVTILEAEAVPIIAGWIDRIADLMTSEEGRRRLRESIAEKLQAGAISRMQVIAAAKAGDQDAESVLRELIVEFISRGRQADMPTELAEYNMWLVAECSPVKHKGGRKLASTWKRDLGIGVLVQLTMKRWHLSKSRGRVSKNPERLVSACYLVSLALNLRGIPIGEREVEDIFASKLADKLAARLSGFFPSE